MAIAFVSGSVLGDTGFAGTIAVPAPASIVAGNLLVAVLGSFTSQTAGPGGWTTVENPTPGGGLAGVGLLYKYATGSEPGTYTFTNASTAHAVAILQYSGTATSSPIDVWAVNHNGSSSAGSCPTITTTGNGEQIVAALYDANALTWTTPTGLTARESYHPGAMSLYVWDEPQVTAGAIGPFSSTGSGSGDWGTLTFAIKAPGAAPPAPRQKQPAVLSRTAIQASLR